MLLSHFVVFLRITFKVVKDMRCYRNLLVQSLDQYKFVYYCIRDAIDARIKVGGDSRRVVLLFVLLLSSSFSSSFVSCFCTLVI